jgi:hypothetical protein
MSEAFMEKEMAVKSLPKPANSPEANSRLVGSREADLEMKLELTIPVSTAVEVPQLEAARAWSWQRK